MPIPSKDLRQTLLRKLEFVELGGSDHDWIGLVIDGREVAKTKFSRGANRDISDPLLAQMARQLYVMPKDLRRIHDCSLSREDYLRRLRDQNRYPRPP